MLLFIRGGLGLADVLEEDGGNVALTKVWQDNYDGLALELRALRQLQSCRDVSTSGNADQ
mgnify:CR=1 FL=1